MECFLCRRKDAGGGSIGLSDAYAVQCQTCGHYQTTRIAARLIQALPHEEQVKLIWATRQATERGEGLQLQSDNLKTIIASMVSPSPPEKVDLFVVLIGTRSPKANSVVPIDNRNDWPLVYAHDEEEFHAIRQMASERQYTRATSAGVMLQPEGWDRHTELARGHSSGSKTQKARTRPADAPPEAPRKKKDEQLFGGRWRNLGDLSEGGQGHVFRVEDSTGELAGVYALKRLKNPKRTHRFAAELRAALALSHPNVLRVVAHDLEASKPFIVSEYHKQGCLTPDYLNSLDLLSRLRLSLGIAEGLAHAHASGVTHRDLKPDNVLLRDDGQPVLADFGVCFIEGQDRHTETDEIIRNRFCTAPEVEDGAAETVLPSSDVYCLGKLFYWILTGRFFGREEHRSPKFDLTAQAPRSAHAIFYELLDVMIVRDPTGRLPSAAEVADLLRSVIRRISMNAHPIDLDAPQECTYCASGTYQIKVDPRHWWKPYKSTQEREERFQRGASALKPYGLEPKQHGYGWLVLGCDTCGHTQFFEMRDDSRWRGPAAKTPTSN